MIFESYPVYEFCLQEKMTKLFIVGHEKRTTKILVLVHTNVYGSFDVQVKDGYVYFITFTDDYSWYEYVYLMKYIVEAFEKFKKFKYEVEK